MPAQVMLHAPQGGAQGRARHGGKIFPPGTTSEVGHRGKIFSRAACATTCSSFAVSAYGCAKTQHNLGANAHKIVLVHNYGYTQVEEYNRCNSIASQTIQCMS